MTELWKGTIPTRASNQVLFTRIAKMWTNLVFFTSENPNIIARSFRKELLQMLEFSVRIPSPTTSPTFGRMFASLSQMLCDSRLRRATSKCITIKWVMRACKLTYPMKKSTDRRKAAAVLLRKQTLNLKMAWWGVIIYGILFYRQLRNFPGTQACLLTATWQPRISTLLQELWQRPFYTKAPWKEEHTLKEDLILDLQKHSDLFNQQMTNR